MTCKPLEIKAVSSVYGRISQMLLAYPVGMADVSEALVLERFGAIFRAFQGRLSFVILGRFEEAMKERLRQTHLEALGGKTAPVRGRLRFCEASSWNNDGQCCPYSEFIQDAFLPLQSNFGHTILLEPDSMEARAGLGRQIAPAIGAFLLPSPFKLEGGNFLIGEDYALIGRNTLLANLELAGRLWGEPAQAHFEQYLRQNLGLRQLIWLGNAEPWDAKGFVSQGAEALQPFFHLDLFLTLLGKNEEGNELVMLAQIDLEHVMGLESQDLPNFDMLNRRLDEVKRQISQADKREFRPKFEVIRNKIGGRMGSAKDGSRKFIPYAHNNALVECHEGKKKIYLPSFPKMEGLQSKLRLLLAENGFEEIQFIEHAFEFFADRGGGLHCLSLVLRRE